ncbi:MAG: hypothetical protein UY06_C0018G0010 [Candidatus Amesbacteria bacterium GW2011_GWA2_47_70]|nr:MAG: hypothetical protein UY06_C0018G0010 [Candidatus Amesbacteria bacterium GW2011_GWA2_47_70]
MGPLVLVIMVSLWSMWPMVGNPRLMTNIGSDGWLITWIMRQPLWGFEGNAFYPHKNVLAYSDMFKISAVVSGGSFARAMIIGQLATMLAVYLWWRSLFKNNWGAAVAAIALGLSQIRWEYQVHLQMWSMQYWLIAVGLIYLWLKGGQIWKLYLGAILLGLQIYESPLPAYFAAAVLGILFFKFQPKFSKHLLLAGIIGGAIILPAVRAYGGVAREFDFSRDIREAAHNSISINDLWGRFWSPGLIVLLAVSLLPGRAGGKSKWLVAILVFGLVMAMGPVVKWQDKTVKIFNTPIPLPYAAAYYVVPGWKGFRTPSRWLWLSAFAASGLIAAGLKNARIERLWWPILVAIVGGTRLTNVISLPEKIPDVYKWLKNQPGKVVLELPLYTWPQEQIEVEKMYYSLYHGKTLVNGFSGFTPPLVYNLASNPINNIPAGTDYIIVHDKKVKLPGKILYQDEENIVYSAR